MMLVRYPASTFGDRDCENGSCEHCQLEKLVKAVLLGKTEKRKCDKQCSVTEDTYGYCGRELGHDGACGRN
jgi:hypothetical protein